MQIGYVSEEPFSPYAIDIYLPEWHLGIEVDGPGHSPKKDAYRDGFLCKEYFLPVLRLKADILLPDAIKKIEDFIVQWATTSEERKHQYRNR
jgi:very-short-patch-repair endonuclease